MPPLLPRGADLQVHGKFRKAPRGSFRSEARSISLRGPKGSAPRESRASDRLLLSRQGDPQATAPNRRLRVSRSVSISPDILHSGSPFDLHERERGGDDAAANSANGKRRGLLDSCALPDAGSCSPRGG